MPPIHAERARRAVQQAPPGTDRPPRRRRSALLAGGLLVASSPFAVGAGLFVPGFAALGLGALLLLLPPVAPHERTRRRPWRLVRNPAAAAGRVTAAGARVIARTGVRASRAVARWSATSGRDGALRIGDRALDAAGALGRSAVAARVRVWAAVEVAAPRVRRALAVTTASLEAEARDAWSSSSTRLRPVLRRASDALGAGGRRAAHECAALSHTATERLSAYIDSRTRAR